jgi:hypothetical protein
MGEFNSELDSVLYRYQEKQIEARDKEREDQKDYIESNNEFRSLFDSIVKPSMSSMVEYLETKGQEFSGSYVKVSPHLPKIALVINAYGLGEGSKSSEIEFSRSEDKLKVVTKGRNSHNQEALFEKSELNPHFVKRILIDFVKSYYQI